MQAELFLSRIGDGIWAAVREDGRTVEFHVEHQSGHPRLGRIVKARVTRVLPAIQAAASGQPSGDEGRLRFAHLEDSWGRLEEGDDPIISVTEDRWRLIYQSRTETQELYDKEVDPDEQNSISSQQPEIVSSLIEHVEAYLEDDQSPWPHEELSIEMNEMEINQLRALGYGIK